MKPDAKYLIFSLALAVLSAIGQYTAYYGNLHSHTSYSDGEETPDDAYAYARDVAGLDFLAVTDHLEQITIQPWNWYFTLNSADDFNVDGSFVAIAGYEWGSPLYNHCNVFNTPNLISTTTLLDLPAFFSDVLDESPAFGQFNHPGEDVTLNWNSFAYVSPEVDSAFPLIEVKEFYQDSFYQMALDSGWHVAPAANQDNHSADWGTRNDSRAGIWATTLSRSAIFDAIMSRRTFSTQDKNASVWIALDGSPMGSSIERTTSMSLTVILDDDDGESWTSISIVGSGGVTFLTLGSHPAYLDTVIELLPGTSDWVYVRAVQPDGQYIWSAPCFLTSEPVDIGENHPTRPEYLSIYAYPNPFNSAVTIAIDGVGAGFTPARVEIYDVAGRRVSVIGNYEQSVIARRASPDEAISYGCEKDCFGQSPRNDNADKVIWRPDESLPSGVYLVRASMDDLDPEGPSTLRQAQDTAGSGTVATRRVVYLK